jgi:hypothetical protein
LDDSRIEGTLKDSDGKIVYERGMERFYADLATAIREGHWRVWMRYDSEEEIVDSDMLLFDSVVSDLTHSSDFDRVEWLSKEKRYERVFIYDPEKNAELVELLQITMDKGYVIAMNFSSEDVVLGNIIVKISGKWFAFGQCRDNKVDDPYVTEIWPLKYVLPQLEKMQVQPQCGESLSVRKARLSSF